MRENYQYRLSLLFSILILLTSDKAFNQSLAHERKKIVGTWVAENGTWTFIFDPYSKCKEYVDGKLEARYKYTITSTNSVCGKKADVNINDKTISFLQLDNIKREEQVCYIINGVSDTVLSMTGYMLPEPSVFTRKKK